MKVIIPVVRAEASFEARLNIISQTLTLQKNKTKKKTPDICLIQKYARDITINHQQLLYRQN